MASLFAKTLKHLLMTYNWLRYIFRMVPFRYLFILPFPGPPPLSFCFCVADNVFEKLFM